MKFRKLTSMLIIALLALSLMACSKEKDAEDKVVIYSTHADSLLELVATEFEKETGIKTEYINLKGELAERVRAEKDNPQADIMFGGASNLFMDLKDEDVFASFEPSWAKDIEPMFKDPEGFWYGTIKTPVVTFYNSEVWNAEDLPKDWKDLADSKYKDHLIFRNALSSSARVMYSALIVEEGWDFMQALDNNTKGYYDSGSLMMQAIGRKEASISFSTLNDIFDNKIKNNLPIEIINLESGFPVITDGIALINNAPHPEAGKQFIEFAGSAKIQSLLANEFNRMPTHPDAISASPEWMGKVEFNVMEVDWVELSEKQSEWMQKWDTEIKGSGKDVQ